MFGLLNDAFIRDPNRVAGAQLGLSLLGAASPMGARVAQGFGQAIQDRRDAPMRDLSQQMAQLKLQSMQQQLRAPEIAAAQQAQIQAALADAMASGKTLTLPDLVMRGVPLDVAVQVLDAQSKGRKDQKVLKPGDTVWDPNTGSTVFENPEKQAIPTGMVRGPDGRLQWEPEYLRGQEQMRRAGASSVNVRLPPQQGEEAKAVGGYFGNQFADLQKADITARSTVNRMDRLEQLMSRINTGRLAGVKKDALSLAQSLGFDLDPSLGDMEAFEALSNEMALLARNPSGGAGMPGAMSDKDREFLQNIVPGLTKTTAGNRLIIETNRRIAKRDQEVARLAREYRKRNGQLDEGFYDVLQRYSDANPLFDGLQVPSAPSTPPASGWQIQRVR